MVRKMPLQCRNMPSRKYTQCISLWFKIINMSTSKIQKRISPFLWFNDNAEEAAKFYTSVFNNSKITATTYYGKSGPGKEGSVMTIAFTLDGEEFVGLNGGPHFKFTEAISFVINCESQEEIDYYWNKLTEGGNEVECGWLKDKFGLSWQVVPVQFFDMITDKDKEKSQRVMGAMMTMKKMDLKKLQDAYEGK